MKTEHQDLWKKITAFSLDDPKATFPFSVKLASENYWSSYFTSRAIKEYKKFIFLTCILPGGASPSAIVDKVWHLHLTYTENYWKEFCGKILEREIHHFPSKGGPEEKEKHKDWYASTLRYYREVFHEDPPLDIWPDDSLTVTNNSVEALSDINYTPAYKKLYLLFIPFLYPLILGKTHPFQLTGPEFLIFYPLLAIAAMIILISAYKIKKKLVADKIEKLYHGNTNVFHISRYVYGHNKLVQSAIVDLVSKEILSAERNGNFRFYPSKYRSETDTENPLIANLLRNYGEGEVIHMRELGGHFNSELTNHTQLSRLYQILRMRYDYYKIAISLFVLLIGVIRFNQGTENDRPVTYLTLMLLITGPVLVIMVSKLRATEMFKNIFENKYRNKELSFTNHQPIAAQFVFLGMASLAGLFLYSNMISSFRYYSTETTSASVAGSSCGGNSSCGSSCGGGCGGCGGGD